MKPRRLLPAALFAALLLPAAAADAKAPSCTRDGFSLEQASGKVRIVTKTLKTNGVNETRREAVSACWTGTGKRFRIATERDFGDDLRSSTRVEIVDERYVGVVETGEGGVSIGVTAAIFDARKAKRLHTSTNRCAVSSTRNCERRISRLAMTVTPSWTISMRTTDEAGMRPRMALKLSPRDGGRWPSISTLPAVPANPRAPLPPSKEKPGIQPSMSKAVAGWYWLKKLAG